jgi:hypothetical protein
LNKSREEKRDMKPSIKSERAVSTGGGTGMERALQEYHRQLEGTLNTLSANQTQENSECTHITTKLDSF